MKCASLRSVAELLGQRGLRMVMRYVCCPQMITPPSNMLTQPAVRFETVSDGARCESKHVPRDGHDG